MKGISITCYESAVLLIIMNHEKHNEYFWSVRTNKVGGQIQQKVERTLKHYDSHRSFLYGQIILWDHLGYNY